MKNGVKVLIVDDDAEYLKDMQILLGKEMKIYTAAYPEVAIELLSKERIDVMLLDIDFSQQSRGIDWLEKFHRVKTNLQIIMVSYFSAPEIIVEALQRGAVDYIHKMADVDEFVTKIKKAINKHYVEEIRNSEKLLFASQAMQRVYNDIEIIAKTNSTVLLLGESGVGKTMIAKIIHEKSQRSNNKFVTLNVPSIAPTLFESELFGHKKGAFTGAINDKKGRIELAENGTLFLDEISEASIEIQAKLLRLLEDKEFERVGDSVTRKADIRVIAASNRDFSKLLEHEKFRSDLYYRLSHFTIEIPPLRERKEDIEILLKHFLKIKSDEFGTQRKFFSNDALKILCEYSWPGNVRELKNVVERLVIKTQNKVRITKEDVLGNIKMINNDFNSGFIRFEEYKDIELRKIKFKYFYELLQKTAGNISKTARLAGISRQSLYRFLNEVGLQINNEV